MKYSKKSRSRRTRRKSKPKLNVIVVAVPVLFTLIFLGFLWFLIQSEARKVDKQSSDKSATVVVDTEELLKKSIEFEEEFEAAFIANPESEQDLALLESALKLQKQYVDALPAYDYVAGGRLQKLEERYQSLASEQLKATSLKLEEAARDLKKAKDYSAAIDKYQEAFELQQTINQDYSRSAAANSGRAIRLQRQVQQLAAEPLLQESLELEQQADRAVDEKDIESATEALKQAISIQEQINRDYRGMPQSDIFRLGKLKKKLAGIESIETYSEIERVLEFAATKKIEGDMPGTAELYQEAFQLQEYLNKTYPESPYVSSKRLVEFREKSQEASSSMLGQEIEKKHAQLQQLLVERQTPQSMELISELVAALQQMETEFPLSPFNDKELKEKIDYLDQIQLSLEFVQDQIYDALLPIPGMKGVHMFRTEIPQDLYTTLVDKNPSRNREDKNPVDSISWTEAEVFCTRASWILAKEVRLPNETEFRQAITGEIHNVNPDEHIWSALNTDGSTQSVGQKKPLESGYYDLLGNVSEWLKETTDQSDSRDVFHIGGHAQDNLEAILAIPVRSASRSARSRLTGFRIVVID